MRGFSTAEYEERLRKARLLMQEKSLEMLLVTSPHNFRYFTGFDSYFWESPTRPWFLLLSLNQDPVAIIPSIGVTALQKTWIQNIKTWQSPNPSDEGVTVLQDAISSVQSHKCSIGCEMGMESHLRMSINDFQKLNSNLPDHAFVDASPLIWKLRMIKSENEISKIKKVISIASKAFDELPRNLQTGQSEIEICNMMKKTLLDLGADHTLYMSCASGPGGYDQIICDPTEKKLQDGDVLIIDTGTTLDGYFCDFDRNYGFGRIADSAKLAYAVLWEAAEAGMKNAKPGATCADVSNAMLSILQKEGLSSNSVGRMGHGIGLQITEPPSIMSNDNTVLEENMVIAIEPCFEYAPGTMLVHEENILITNNRHERLTSRTPQTIPMIN
ncbi:MAG: Xaa-Pro peptidase family protein [SAR324 cluster bacterium]|nr:Xaa-Pro peptidase family protein [SAR324 cluster bacterium]